MQAFFREGVKTQVMKSVFLSGLVGWAALSNLAYAEVSQDVQSGIQGQLQKMIPNAPQAEITKTPVDGLYQVALGMQIVYMSADGKFLLNGSLIDLERDANLTKAASNAKRKQAMQKIPESSMVVYPGKDTDQSETGRYMTVFTDIDCPYCTKLHKEIPQLTEAGVTVRYLAYPRAGVGSESYKKAVSVWCSSDKAKTMDSAMNKQTIATKSCENPVQAHMLEAQRFGVNGTPNIVLDNGELLPGYVPAQELIKIFKNPA